MTWSGDAKEVGNRPCGYLGEECSKQKEQPVQRPYRRSMPGMCKEPQRGRCGWSRGKEGKQEEMIQESLGIQIS